MNPRRFAAALVLLTIACKDPSPAGQSASAGGASDGRVEHPRSASTLRKNDPHRVEINAGETQEWGIDLAAGEPIVLTIDASSTGAGLCQNWTWGFYNPSGGALREEPVTPSENGHWALEIRQRAQASIVEGDVAGRYLVRVTADTACPQLRYTLTAR